MEENTIEQLVNKINELEEELKRTKKYGLVWDKEHVPENVVLECEKKIPILKRDDKKNVINNGENNILIEGDNYHALTALNFIAKESIDVIYIDPPYNTGKVTNAGGFKYNDRYVDEDDGFFHSKWLNFIEKRLILAKNILKDSGIIFISIGDDEQANLKLLCDEIFGRYNFIENYIWESTFRPDNSSPLLRRNAEFVLCYAKNKNLIKYFNGDVSESSGMPSLTKGKETVKTIIFPANYVKTTLPDGIYKKGIKDNGSQLKWELIEDAIVENGIFKTEVVLKGHSYWATQKKIQEEKDSGTEIWIKSEAFVPYYKKAKTSINRPTKILNREITKDYLFSNTQINDIFKTKPFNNPKPTTLIKYLINFIDKKDLIILDFFAGSGTTGQAVLELNNEDGGHRRFILCTNNENNICTDVTYPRIKTVLTGIRSDGTKYSDGLPGNLYYFKTDFINDEANIEQAKYNLVEKVDSLLCIAENIFNEVERNDYSSHYASNDLHLFIYNDYFNETKFNEFKDRVLKVNGKKIVYIYSSDNTVDKTLIEGNNIELKPIPSKIYEIYKELVEQIKRGD